MEKWNTKYQNDFKSYQLGVVSMFKMKILTFLMFKKVYKNENCILENIEQQFCNVAVRKQFEGN